MWREPQIRKRRKKMNKRTIAGVLFGALLILLVMCTVMGVSSGSTAPMAPIAQEITVAAISETVSPTVEVPVVPPTFKEVRVFLSVENRNAENLGFMVKDGKEDHRFAVYALGEQGENLGLIAEAKTVVDEVATEGMISRAKIGRALSGTLTVPEQTVALLIEPIFEQDAWKFAPRDSNMGPAFTRTPGSTTAETGIFPEKVVTFGEGYAIVIPLATSTAALVYEEGTPVSMDHDYREQPITAAYIGFGFVPNRCP